MRSLAYANPVPTVDSARRRNLGKGSADGRRRRKPHDPNPWGGVLGQDRGSLVAFASAESARRRSVRVRSLSLSQFGRSPRASSASGAGRTYDAALCSASSTASLMGPDLPRPCPRRAHQVVPDSRWPADQRCAWVAQLWCALREIFSARGRSLFSATGALRGPGKHRRTASASLVGKELHGALEEV